MIMGALMNDNDVLVNITVMQIRTWVIKKNPFEAPAPVRTNNENKKTKKQAKKKTARGCGSGFLPHFAVLQTALSEAQQMQPAEAPHSVLSFQDYNAHSIFFDSMTAHEIFILRP